MTMHMLNFLRLIIVASEQYPLFYVFWVGISDFI